MAGKRRQSNKGREPRQAADGAPKRRNRRRKRLLTTLIVLIALLGAGGAAVYFYFFDGHVLQNWLKLVAPATLKPPTRLTTCPLDGAIVKDARLINRRPIVVKVENLSDARPQSGLDKADIVYEMMAEGGITRFAAVFLCRDVDEIGPVRSARQQDPNFVHEYDALFAHVGGSDAWAAAKDKTIADLDQFAFDDAYWRSAERSAPHNVYTTTQRLYKAAVSEGLEKQVSIDPWPFKADQPGAGTTVSVDVPYTAGCALRYDYDKASNTYKRSVEGEPFLDKPTGAQIAPKNVVIQFVSYSSSDDGEEYGLGGRDFMELTGEGRAIVIRDGEAIEGRWLKPGEPERTMFLDSEGRPIKFDRGQTWVEIIPTTWEVTLGSGQK